MNKKAKSRTKVAAKAAAAKEALKRMKRRKEVCDTDESGAFKYYFDHGVDKLDERAQDVLHRLYGKLDDEVENLIRNLLHERRWMRGEIARRKREKPKKQEGNGGAPSQNGGANAESEPEPPVSLEEFIDRTAKCKVKESEHHGN